MDDGQRNVAKTMENRSQFSLEAAIAGWRKQVTGSAVACEDLSELEAHLRDSIAARQQGGLSEEDAFAIASYRIGHGSALAEEFAKAYPERVWFERVLW